MSLHAEVPGNINIFELHEVIDMAEINLANKFNCMATIHMDPIDTENERLKDLKKLAKEIASEIDEEITIHDVRMVPGETHTNLIFDAVRPYNCKFSKEELKKELSNRIQKVENDINCVITIDEPFVNV